MYRNRHEPTVTHCRASSRTISNIRKASLSLTLLNICINQYLTYDPISTYIFLITTIAHIGYTILYALATLSSL